MLEILILLFRLKLKLTEIQMPAQLAMYASVLSLKGRREKVVARAEANSPDPTQYIKIQMGSRASLGQISKCWSTENGGPAGPERSTLPHIYTRCSLYKTHFTCFAQSRLLPPNIKKENETFTFPTVIPQPPHVGLPFSLFQRLSGKDTVARSF